MLTTLLHHQRNLLTQDKDEELVLFMNIRRRQEKRHRPVPPMGSDYNNNSCTTPMSSTPYPLRKNAAENLLYSEDDKSDYEWLVTPPGSPSRNVTNQLEAPDANPMTLISLLENYSKGEWHNVSPKSQTTSLHNSSSVSGISRPSSSSSSRSTSKPPTPTRRSITPAIRVSTPTQRAISTTTPRNKSTSSSTIGSRSTSRPSCSSGTSRANLTASRVTKPTTTSTGQQTNGSAAFARSSKRPISAPNSKPGSRSSTPTIRPSSPATVLRNIKPGLSQGAFPIVRSRPWEPYDMPGFSLEAPSNLRTTLPDRPQTSSSNRTTREFCASSSSKRSASIERNVVRRQSCSPSRNRAPIRNVNTDDRGLTSHVAKGNQKVDRFLNVGKLSPPRLTQTGSSAGKSISGSEGFGFLSKSSMDMALRHMDVRRGNLPGITPPSVTKISYSVRSWRNRPRSSSGSSESSVSMFCA